MTTSVTIAVVPSATPDLEAALEQLKRKSGVAEAPRKSHLAQTTAAPVKKIVPVTTSVRYDDHRSHFSIPKSLT